MNMIKLLSTTALLGAMSLFSNPSQANDPRQGDCVGNVCVIVNCGAMTCIRTTNVWAQDMNGNWYLVSSSFEIVDPLHRVR